MCRALSSYHHKNNHKKHRSCAPRTIEYHQKEAGGLKWKAVLCPWPLNVVGRTPISHPDSLSYLCLREVHMPQPQSSARSARQPVSQGELQVQFKLTLVDKHSTRPQPFLAQSAAPLIDPHIPALFFHQLSSNR